MRGEAASQWGIIVEIDLEEVEKGIVDGFEGAIDVWKCQQEACTIEVRHWYAFFNAKVKLERSPRLVACHERYILKLTLIICDLPKSASESKFEKVRPFEGSTLRVSACLHVLRCHCTQDTKVSS